MRAIRPRSRSRTRSAHAGESKYSLYKLIRLNFDLVTGFSLVPLQFFSMLRHLLRWLLSLAVRAAAAAPRSCSAPEAEGCSPCSRIIFFLHRLSLFGIGLLGEYVGRIYQQVRGSPRYVVQAILQDEPERCPLHDVANDIGARLP